MKEPTHNIKRRFVNCNGAFWTTHNEHHGWLGSGLKDKNGKEIYEGDIIRTPCNTATVVFANGMFWLNGEDLATYVFGDDIEIIGHIADAEKHHDA